VSGSAGHLLVRLVFHGVVLDEWVGRPGDVLVLGQGPRARFVLPGLGGGAPWYPDRGPPPAPLVCAEPAPGAGRAAYVLPEHPAVRVEVESADLPPSPPRRPPRRPPAEDLLAAAGAVLLSALFVAAGPAGAVAGTMPDAATEGRAGVEAVSPVVAGWFAGASSSSPPVPARVSVAATVPVVFGPVTASPPPTERGAAPGGRPAPEPAGRPGAVSPVAPARPVAAARITGSVRPPPVPAAAPPGSLTVTTPSPRAARGPADAGGAEMASRCVGWGTTDTFDPPRRVQVAFVVDVSTTMATALPVLEAAIRSLPAASGRARPEVAFAMVAYVDDVVVLRPRDPFVSRWADLSASYARIRGRADDNLQLVHDRPNEDWPENALDALAAAANLPWDEGDATERVVVWVTDDTFAPKGTHLSGAIPVRHGYDEVTAALARRGIRVWALAAETGGPAEDQDVRPGIFDAYDGHPSIPTATGGFALPLDSLLYGPDTLPKIVEMTMAPGGTCFTWSKPAAGR